MFCILIDIQRLQGIGLLVYITWTDLNVIVITMRLKGRITRPSLRNSALTNPKKNTQKANLA
jgi:hypothetical protein